LGANTDQITFSEKKANGKKTYSWKAENLPANLYEEDAPAIAYYAPHVMVYIHEAAIDGKSTTYLGDVSHLYDWYCSMLKNINKSDNKQLQTLAKEITKDCKTDKDKVRSIFQWVQTNIRYIAIEDGWGGFIPTDASEVYIKRYGDCKGMANLTKELLAQAGISSNLTWIGTRSLPYVYQQMPAPIADNHMIVSVELDKQTIFLDATDSYVPFGMPTSMIQGKEALIGMGEKKFKVLPVPIVDYIQNSSLDTIKLQIPEGFTIKHLPANVSWEGKDYGFAITYQLQANKIIMHKKSYIKTIMLKREAFPQWNAMIAQLCKAYQDVLILTKQGA
jgi:hypothetical protein